jgi:hypothetical protein
MSSSFDVSFSQLPRFAPLLSSLNFPELRCVELVDDDTGAPALLNQFPDDAWPQRRIGA